MKHGLLRNESESRNPLVLCCCREKHNNTDSLYYNNYTIPGAVYNVSVLTSETH